MRRAGPRRQIIVGLVLGPYGFDVVPQTRACTIAGELGSRYSCWKEEYVDLKTLRGGRGQ